MIEITYRKFVSCTRKNIAGLPSPFDDEKMNVIEGMANFSVVFLNDLADRQYENCLPKDECIAVVPDWWQVRLGANRPQLMVSYAAKFPDGAWDKAKYVISIPHWKKTKEQTSSTDFPSYRKGQYQGIMVLNDNSKIIVNGFTGEETLRAIDKITAGVVPIFLENAVTKMASRRGRTLSTVAVYPRSARYFGTGQMNLEPDWILKFP